MKEENEEKLIKGKSIGEKSEILWYKGRRKDKFFFFHFQETTETFKGSTKMEISTGKHLKSRREKPSKVTLPPPLPREKVSCYATVFGLT